MKSNVIKVYAKFLSTATNEQIDFVDSVYALCEEHYEHGGDRIVECWEPASILGFFKDLEEVREFCGLFLEQKRNCDWGE